MDTSKNFFLEIPEEYEGSGLPLGFRFHPTDVELLEHYLIPKIKSEQLASDFIMDFNVFQCDPQQLPLSQSKNTIENQRYFFTMVKRKELVEFNTNRPTPSGYWKIYKANKPIYGANGIIGFKDTYSFYNGKDLNGDNKTDWKMNEFRCNPSLVPTTSNGVENYIICKVLHKKEKSENALEENVDDSDIM